ncbi:hypothetical protein HU675_0035285 [Bradyrhizobium septentrionale]|uniref:hypothetical protein n=1 Tax=Bradyrhizobium septentrionale TaxID=1404411 RepID=UPI001596DE65|nr:hypothetical protein [Bradyrhizobium septentrionale]UGY23182.1 hypothetical protein HU675_0035285 [Bradyrhizobium septentrionale]
MRIVFRYLAMQDIVDFAIETLRERSPVGSVDDPHPGLYRDSHTVFLNGHVVRDVSAFRRGDQINISNPVPYSRKIEIGRMKMKVEPKVYQETVLLVAARFGNRAAVKFTFMPVRFGDVAAYAAFSQQIKAGRRHMSDKARQDWLVRQPALEIRAR